MREILFRGKCFENGEWLYGYLSSKHTISVESPIGNIDEVVIDPTTVGQYTGLTDMNGVKIFEGDILKDTWDGEEIIACVEYRANYFGVLYQHNVSNAWSPVLVGNSFYPIVIGNIYDNPELASRIK